MSRDERGSGTVLAATLLLVVLGLVAALAIAARMAADHARLRGAADLAAVSAGQAQLGGTPACDVARSTALANGAGFVACTVAGDEVEFVVSVRVSQRVGWGPWHAAVEETAHAGVLTGAPG